MANCLHTGEQAVARICGTGPRPHSGCKDDSLEVFSDDVDVTSCYCDEDLCNTAASLIPMMNLSLGLFTALAAVIRMLF